MFNLTSAPYNRMEGCGDLSSGAGNDVDSAPDRTRLPSGVIAGGEPFGHRDGVDDGEGVPVAETAGARRWGEAQPVGERRRRPALDAGH
eukprot:gene3834-biopygen125